MAAEIDTPSWQFETLPSAAVLARDPHRVAAELWKAGVVDDPGGGLELLGHPAGEALSNRAPVPRRLVDELLQALLVAILEPSRHRLDRLAPAVEHQPAHVDLAPAALILARHRLKHLRGEVDEPAPDPRELPRLQPGHVLHCHPPRLDGGRG